MIPKLTDDAIADLPLHAGRAELLEEIMTTPVLDRPTPDRATPPSRHRWLVPLAAAAAVAVLASSPAWWPEGDGATPTPTPAPGPAQQSEDAHLAVLDATGWKVVHVHVSADGQGGEIGYTKGGWSLEIRWDAASTYDSYVEDREDITQPPAPGDPVEVLGLGGQLWAYSATDHTVIREVQDGYWLEIRGSGPDRTGYLDLLKRLRLVGLDEFEAMLPTEYVTRSERAGAVAGILDEIEQQTAPYPVLPRGLDRASIRSKQSDPYNLGADVAGAVACAWITAYADGDAQEKARAQDVLATARDWPVLQRMSERGDYPEAVWHYADQVVAGTVPEGYEGGLGCG